MRTQIYDINLVVGAGIPPIVKVSQNDELRVLAFRLFDGIREYFPFENEEVTITGTKPSGLGFTEECSVNGSLATVETTLAMTQESGYINAELRISDGSTNIGTANFVLYVEPAPHPAGTTDGTTEEARTVLAQCEEYAQSAQDAAETAAQNATAAVQDAVTQIIESLPSDYSELAEAVSGKASAADLGTLSNLTTTAKGNAVAAINEVNAGLGSVRADLEDLDERVEALEEGGSGGSGLTDAVKTALMNIVNHLAWDDDDPTGQTYITALYDALYPPAPPASLTSITAVYTQSGTVYDTDTLNDLKSDLVVTAHYSDNTSHAVTDYTLSGTLAVGTSVIAANYNGKSTTFTVTVTAGALYPLENGSHTFTENSRVLTVTNGKHFVYEWPNATSAAVNGAYLNLSTVSDNDTSATTADNVLVNDPLFTIPANAQVVFEIKNISFSNVGAGGSNNYAFNIRNGATSLGMGSGNKGISDTADISITKTFDVDTPATCIFLYVSRQFSRFEADISLKVNNVRWI